MEIDLNGPTGAAQSTKGLWTGPRDDPARYRVQLTGDTAETVGDGGEGLVFRAACEIDGEDRPVALKMHTAVPSVDYGRIVARARVLSGIDHPNVMHVRDAFVGSGLTESPDPDNEDAGVLYTVADWIPGRPLHEVVSDTNPTVALHWVAQIARAAGFLHGYRSDEAPFGIVHRDIKPSNVRITPDDVAVLIDFGIARPNNEDLTEGAGTYLWRAPEVLGGPGSPGSASDAWGIGALAHWVLVGEPPRLDGADAARNRLAPAAQAAGLSRPGDVGMHIAELLETNPERRPDDLPRWADDLDRLIAGSRRRFRWSRRSLSLVAAAVVLVGLVAGVVVALTNSPNGHREVHYAFNPEKYPSGLIADETWTLSGATGNQLSARIVLTNGGPITLRSEYDLVIPMAVAASYRQVTFVPSFDKVVKSNPVVVFYNLNLRSGRTLTITYTVNVGVTHGNWLPRLVALADAQANAQIAFLHSSGKPAPATLASLQVTPSQLSLEVGQTGSVAVSGTMSDRTEAPPTVLKGIAWSSKDPSTASVSEGIVTAVGAGSTTVTAQAGPLSVPIAVTVTATAGQSVISNQGVTNTTKANRQLSPINNGSPVIGGSSGSTPSGGATTSPTGGGGPSPPTGGSPTSTVPLVTGLSSHLSTTAGGVLLTVTGNNLTGATAVRFGTVLGTGLIVNGPTSLTVTSPAETNTGTVDVSVTTPEGSSLVNAPADSFTYVLPVQITASADNFHTSPGATVRFDFTFTPLVALASGWTGPSVGTGGGGVTNGTSIGIQCIINHTGTANPDGSICEFTPQPSSPVDYLDNVQVDSLSPSLQEPFMVSDEECINYSLPGASDSTTLCDLEYVEVDQ